MAQNATTREQILRAALKRFADAGYAGTSVQDIVDAARVTKPTLYYYFQSKAGLYQALIDQAHDERLRLMQEAVARGGSFEEQLIGVLTALFEFFQNHRALMRLAFMTAFAAAGEMPREIRYLEKCTRNYDFMRGLIRQGQAAGVLTRRFADHDLTLALLGHLNIYIMGQVLRPDHDLNRRTAARIVALFLDGAATQPKQDHSRSRTR